MEEAAHSWLDVFLELLWWLIFTLGGVWLPGAALFVEGVPKSWFWWEMMN